MMTIPVKGTHIMRKHPKPMPDETRALLAFAFSFVASYVITSQFSKRVVAPNVTRLTLKLFRIKG